MYSRFPWCSLYAIAIAIAPTAPAPPTEPFGVCAEIIVTEPGPAPVVNWSNVDLTGAKVDKWLELQTPAIVLSVPEKAVATRAVYWHPPRRKAWYGVRNYCQWR